MKNKIQNTLMFVLICCATTLFAQSEKPVYGVLNVDVTGTTALDQEQLGNALRRNLEQMDTFQVIDRYDIDYLLQDTEGASKKNCFGTICLSEIGKKIQAEYMLTGSVDVLGDKLILTLRIINVASGKIEKASVIEYLNIQKEIGYMIKMSLNSLFGKQNPDPIFKSLTKQDAFANSFNKPYAPQLRVDGPRFGVSALSGKHAEIMKKPLKDGGFDAYPISFHFGYQFEKQYLSHGNFQALFEFIPMVTGLDQGRINGSLTLMNGLRWNRSGWELAFGPQIGMTKVADVALAPNGDLLTKKEWETKYPGQNPADGFTRQFDSRGMVVGDASFVFAVGKTFKSGKLNIPVNLFVIPKKNDLRFGLSLGYNASSR